MAGFTITLLFRNLLSILMGRSNWLVIPTSWPKSSNRWPTCPPPPPPTPHHPPPRREGRNWEASKRHSCPLCAVPMKKKYELDLFRQSRCWTKIQPYVWYQRPKCIQCQCDIQKCQNLYTLDLVTLLFVDKVAIAFLYTHKSRCVHYRRWGLGVAPMPSCLKMNTSID